MQTVQIPPARREMLEAMSDAELAAELASINDALSFHEPHVLISLRATRACEALYASRSHVVAIQEERS